MREMLSSAAGSGPMGQNKKRKQERAIRAIRLVYYLRGESSVTWNRGNPHTHTHTHKNTNTARSAGRIVVAVLGIHRVPYDPTNVT